MKKDLNKRLRELRWRNTHAKEITHMLEEQVEMIHIVHDIFKIGLNRHDNRPFQERIKDEFQRRKYRM